jgi:hypothetical protein
MNASRDAIDEFEREMTMAKLVRGDQLTQSTRQEVLRVFVYRLTTENGYPKRNPTGARVSAISDAEWIAYHAFYVNKDGTLSRKHNHAEPAYLAEDE